MLVCATAVYPHTTVCMISYELAPHKWYYLLYVKLRTLHKVMEVRFRQVKLMWLGSGKNTLTALLKMTQFIRFQTPVSWGEGESPKPWGTTSFFTPISALVTCSQSSQKRVIHYLLAHDYLWYVWILVDFSEENVPTVHENSRRLEFLFKVSVNIMEKSPQWATFLLG